jgi:hypothetical protein
VGELPRDGFGECDDAALGARAMERKKERDDLGGFFAILRLYAPAHGALDGRWEAGDFESMK